MLKNNYFLGFVCLFFFISNVKTQILSLDSVLNTITADNPQLKMFDADIQSMDAQAVGAKSWMAPQLNSGFFMTPYNPMMWKADGNSAGMGAYMIGATQMIPNPKKIEADYKYMSAMSSVEKENKGYTINQLHAFAKANYYQWLVLTKKMKILNENLLLLDYMIKTMEIRFQYNMDKLSAYYKAKSQYGSLESMIVMIENNITQKRIMLNTLMARDKNSPFEIDTAIIFTDDEINKIDTSLLSKDRSDIKAIDKTIELNELRIESEKMKQLPEFGVKYDHMFAFGQRPQQFSLMAMVTIPMPWSTKMNKAVINSFQLKNESLSWQKQMVLNEATGMLTSMHTESQNVKKQYEISENTIIPALKRNYDIALLAWQNNTGELFVVLDAWEALNMAQIDALDKLQAILMVQVEIEKQLEK